MKVKCECEQKDCPEPEYEVQVWVGFNMKTGLPKDVCIAYYKGDRPKDIDLTWVLMQEVSEGTPSIEDWFKDYYKDMKV